MRFIPIHKHQNYAQKIVPILQQLRSQKLSPQEISQALASLRFYSSVRREKYNQKYRIDNPRHKVLKKVVDAKDLKFIFAKLAGQVLSNENGENLDLQILQAGKANQLSYNKKQMMYYMSLMALDLVSFQEYDSNPKLRSCYPFTNNFTFIFEQEQFKTKTIMSYFKQYYTSKNEQKDNQNFTIRRQVLKQSIQQVIKQKGHLKMTQFQIKDNHDSIQDYYGHIKVDFANKFIGGGALNSGCVQQEIMFTNHPQLLTSVLFCQVMRSNQALFFTGFKKYSKNQGYGWTTKYAGQQRNIPYQIDQRNRAKQYIVAVDALHYYKQFDPIQCKRQTINRELTKAYVGFNNQQKLNIITGNWGCGAFNGDLNLKFLIQWIACSLAQKKMVYCPYGSKKTILYNSEIHNQLKKKSVYQVYQLLIKTGYSVKSMKQNIFQSMAEYL